MAERFVVTELTLVAEGPKLMRATFKLRHMNPDTDPNGRRICIPPIEMVLNRKQVRKAKELVYGKPPGPLLGPLIMTLYPSKGTSRAYLKSANGFVLTLGGFR